MNVPVIYEGEGEGEDLNDYEFKELTNSDKLYLGAFAILIVGILFMASKKLK